MLKYYLGVDPGRDKTGLALLDENSLIVKVKVAKSSSLRAEIKSFLQIGQDENKVYNPVKIIEGDGTTSLKVHAVLQEFFPEEKIKIIDESFSTQEGRKLYWKHNPPKGWRRFLPLSLQTPPVFLDGWAAAVLVLRFLSSEKEKN